MLPHLHTHPHAPAPVPRTPRLCRRANHRMRTRARARRRSRRSHLSAPSRHLAVRAPRWRATTRTLRPLSARGSSRRSAPASVSARTALCLEVCHLLAVSAHWFQTEFGSPCVASFSSSLPHPVAAVGMMMLVMFSLYAVGLYFGSTLSASICGDAVVGTSSLQSAQFRRAVPCTCVRIAAITAALSCSPSRCSPREPRVTRRVRPQPDAVVLLQWRHCDASALQRAHRRHGARAGAWPGGGGGGGGGGLRRTTQNNE